MLMDAWSFSVLYPSTIVIELPKPAKCCLKFGDLTLWRQSVCLKLTGKMDEGGDDSHDDYKSTVRFLEEEAASLTADIDCSKDCDCRRRIQGVISDVDFS